MKHRYSIKELSEMSDNEMLRAIIADRMGDCSNVYAPLHKKLSYLYDKIDEKVKAERRKAH